MFYSVVSLTGLSQRWIWISRWIHSYMEKHFRVWNNESDPDFRFLSNGNIAGVKMQNSHEYVVKTLLVCLWTRRRRIMPSLTSHKNVGTHETEPVGNQWTGGTVVKETAERYFRNGLCWSNLICSPGSEPKTFRLCKPCFAMGHGLRMILCYGPKIMIWFCVTAYSTGSYSAP